MGSADSSAPELIRTELAPECRRVFILTSGRSGSTLLASILADAGANFGMPASEDWDVARGGDMEHPAIRRAANHFRLAFERSPNKPVTTPSKWIWSYHLSAGKRHLRKALREAVCLKAVNIDLAVPHAIKMGYFPQIIISCRPFGESALSLSQMLTSRTLDTFAEDYDRFHRNAALQLQAYGGCVVEYRDLTDPARTQWAHSLEACTGLPAGAILASRARRAKPVQSPDAELPVLFESTERTFAMIQALSGRAVPPSPAALRNWARKMRDDRATVQGPAVPADGQRAR
jgi:hypothetical protein